MEGGQGADTAVQADHAHGAESAGAGAAGHSHSHCATMAVHGQRRQRGAEVRTSPGVRGPPHVRMRKTWSRSMGVGVGAVTVING